MKEAPIHNPELVLSMNVLKAEDTPDARKAFSNALSGARLLAPVQLENVLDEHDRQPDGSVALEQKTKVRYVLFSRSDGKKVFPAFTDWDELHKWSTDPHQTVILTLKDYARLMSQAGNEAAGLALNPMGQNLFVPAEGLRPKQLFDPAKPINIGTPKELPAAITDGLQRVLAAQSNVKEGWLKVMTQEKSVSWLLVVALDENANLKETCNALAKAGAAVTGKVPLTVTLHLSDLGKKAIANSLPFYIRG